MSKISKEELNPQLKQDIDRIPTQVTLDAFQSNLVSLTGRVASIEAKPTPLTAMDLSDSVISESSTKAATSKAVKTVKDSLDSHVAEIATTSKLGHIKPDGSTIIVDPVTGVASAAASASVEDASTTQKGIVQLNDTTTSTSTSLAATANAVKIVRDYVEGSIIVPSIQAGFSEAYTGAFRAHKSGRMVAIQATVSNTSQLQSGITYTLASVPVGYRPTVNSALGNLFYINGNTVTAIPAVITSSGIITLHPISNVASGNILQGHIVYVTESL